YVAILNIVFIYGLDSAYLKFAAFKDIGDDKDNFSTPYIAVFATSLLISLLIVINVNVIGTSFGIPAQYNYLIYLAIAIIFVDANAVIPFLKLRLERRAKIFSLFKIINICVNIFLNLYLILVLKWGIEAVFVSNLIATVVSLLLVSPTIIKNFKFKFHTLLFKRMLKFGLPFLPAGFAVMLVQVIDVPILQKLTDLRTVGIYKANYKLGIFMMLFVNMFQYAWQPFFLQNAKDPSAREMFSKVLTYFVLVGSILLIVLSLFINDVAKIQIAGYSLIGSEYWSGLNIIPIVLLAYLINGMYVIFSAGIYIEEKSIYVPIITGLGALVNVVANFILIPVLNITGAALATLAAYFVMALGYYYVTQKFYKVKYELKRIGHIFLAVLLVGILFYYLRSTGNLYFIYKMILLILFTLYLYFVAINRNEIKLIRTKYAESRRKKK
ncbi:MAG: polysaccharide biosynthesis C-terminal domain-containing protein, partial [Ignavibacteriaceae bacterium]|nr:polysaccharide biosynthesis C-terminal domain-containing protein [Ignavibacteriaceae bacterium]